MTWKGSSLTIYAVNQGAICLTRLPPAAAGKAAIPASPAQSKSNLIVPNCWQPPLPSLRDSLAAGFLAPLECDGIFYHGFHRFAGAVQRRTSGRRLRLQAISFHSVHG